jgi:hypothetical protein
MSTGLRTTVTVDSGSRIRSGSIKLEVSYCWESSFGLGGGLNYTYLIINS